MELIKNNRFRTGSTVDIYHTPVYEGYTIAMTDQTVGGQFLIDAQFPTDISIEQFGIGDICAFSFGVGQILEMGTSENLLLHSNDFSNPVWTLLAGTLEPAELNSTKIVSVDLGGSNTDHHLYQDYVKPATATKYTISARVKADGCNVATLNVKHTVSVSPFPLIQAVCDLTSGNFTNLYDNPDYVLNSTGSFDEGGGWYRIYATFTTDLETNIRCSIQLGQGIYAGDGVSGILVKDMMLSEGEINFYVPTTTTSNSVTLANDIVRVTFPNSMFPDTNVMTYVGSEIQHCLFFLRTGRVEANFSVARYKEEVNQATYGFAKTVYNLQTEAELILTPIRMVDDGTISKLLYSKGFVLGACDTTNYTPSTSWNQEFPLELSGTSIDPIYRRAFLVKREMESKSRRSKAKMTFRLIG